MNIKELITRLEATSQPDRLLDAEIHVALFEPKPCPDDLRYYRVPHPSMDHMEMCAPGTYWLKERSGASLQTAPYYTREFSMTKLVRLLKAYVIATESPK